MGFESSGDEHGVRVNLDYEIVMLESRVLVYLLEGHHENFRVQYVLDLPGLCDEAGVQNGCLDSDRWAWAKPRFYVTEDGPILARKDAGAFRKLHTHERKLVTVCPHHRKAEK